jgi:hypothetical protein
VCVCVCVCFWNTPHYCSICTLLIQAKSVLLHKIRLISPALKGGGFTAPFPASTCTSPDQEVEPANLYANAVTPQLRPPHAPVGEIEEHGRVRSAGRLDAPDCVTRFRCHTALPSLLLAKCVFNGRTTSAHRAVTWVWGGCVRLPRAHSLSWPPGCDSCRSGC